MDHTSEGIVQCQGQNPCGIIAGLTKPIGFTQVSSSKVTKMLIKCRLILMSILQGVEVKYCNWRASHLVQKLSYPISTLDSRHVLVKMIIIRVTPVSSFAMVQQLAIGL